MKKRLLACMLAMGLAAGLLTGCGGGDKSKSSKSSGGTVLSESDDIFLEYQKV